MSSKQPSQPSQTSQVGVEKTPSVQVRGVTKLYRRSSPGERFRTLKSALLFRSLTAGFDRSDAIEAVQGVDFEVPSGEAFGVIGGNGSGKSTLLKVLAGILPPNEGEVLIQGRLAALIELGAGFHPEISGRENVFINGAILGLTRREIESRYDRIVEFAGLADFMEEPVKYYSSGMYVRLGFAVAVHTDPDVLLIDEVLAVGDAAFTHRCLNRIEEMLASGKTLIFVSHDLTVVESLCDRVLWLDQGKPRMIGSPRRVVDAYRQSVAEAEGEKHRQEMQASEGEQSLEEDGDVVLRWGNGAAEILSVRWLVGESEEERYHFRTGEGAVLEIRAQAAEPLSDFVFGVSIATPRDIVCWGTNTDLDGFESRRFEGEETVRLEFPNLRLAPGDYNVDVALHDRDGTAFDYRRKLFSITVLSDLKGEGVYFPEHRWTAGESVLWQLPEKNLDS